jgi:hypothetical protein
MPSVISYQKFINEQITREINLPTDASGQRLGQEIATVNGITYVSLPDGAKLPADQPAEIAASIKPVALNVALRQQLADASPRVLFIRNMVATKIAARYSMTDEIKLLRTAPSAEFESYNAYVEDCRAEGRAMKAALGL